MLQIELGRFDDAGEEFQKFDGIGVDRGEGLGVQIFGRFQHLQPVFGFVGLLQRDAIFVDEVRTAFSLFGFADQRTNRGSGTK